MKSRGPPSPGVTFAGRPSLVALALRWLPSGLTGKTGDVLGIAGQARERRSAPCAAHGVSTRHGQTGRAWAKLALLFRGSLFDIETVNAR
jgi:hypothetical protein